MNILLTSVGRRSYLVEYFKESLKDIGKVFVSNSFDGSPAFKYAHGYVITPIIYDENYIDFLKKYCLEKKIKAIIPLFDIDLLVLSKHKKEFEEIGIKVIVSSEEVIEICNDKWKTILFLNQNDLKTPKSFIYLEDAVKSIQNKKMEFPIILKPRWGMGSISVYEAENIEELEVFYKKIDKEIYKTYLKYESKK
ncbi:MAG: ATP-grasp domain-containing protein, partial [Fusobacteriaceae bacterium]